MERFNASPMQALHRLQYGSFQKYYWWLNVGLNLITGTAFDVYNYHSRNSRKYPALIAVFKCRCKDVISIGGKESDCIV